LKIEGVRVSDVTVSEEFLRQFVDGLKESAAAQQASASAQRESATASQAIASELRALRDATEAGRKEAVIELKNHVATTIETKIKLANKWPSIWLGLLTVIATVAVGILGVMAARKP
jgi:hydrogenase maturation factor